MNKRKPSPKKMTKHHSYTTSFVVNQLPEAAFAAINNVREWWSESIEGRTDKIGAHFRHHLPDVHRCDIEVTDLIPGEKVVWTVVDNYFSFTKDKTEWKGSYLVFDIIRISGKTEVRFTHVGLVPEWECYGVCTNAWDGLINGSLRDLIHRGRGQPDPRHAGADDDPLSGR
jgi:hypothetical protein